MDLPQEETSGHSKPGLDARRRTRPKEQQMAAYNAPRKTTSVPARRREAEKPTPKQAQPKRPAPKPAPKPVYSDWAMF